MGNRRVSISVLEDLDLVSRSYLLTHDDRTGHLLVHIGRVFPDDLYGPARDEVLAYLDNGTFKLECELDNPNSKFPTQVRLEIFEAHMRNSVLAIYLADEDLAQVLDWPLEITYKSVDRAYHKTECHETLRAYIYDGDGLRQFDSGFDYRAYFKSLKNK